MIKLNPKIKENFKKELCRESICLMKNIFDEDYLKKLAKDELIKAKTDKKLWAVCDMKYHVYSVLNKSFPKLIYETLIQRINRKFGTSFNDQKYSLVGSSLPEPKRELKVSQNHGIFLGLVGFFWIYN